MPRFQSLSIKRQLMLLIMLTSGVVLLAACAAFVAYDQFVLGQTMKRDLAMTADIIGRNSRSPLAYADPTRAERSLITLQAAPHVLAAAIYSTNNAVFAKYTSTNAPGATVPAQPEEPGLPHFQQGRLRVFQAITGFDGEPLGTLYLESGLDERWVRLRRFSAGVLVIMVGAFLVVFLLSSKFQGLISEPLNDLARTARRVSDERDYSIRAVKREGEIGFLTDQFNGMLAQIEARDKEVKEVNEQLRESEHRAQTATQAKSQFLANMSHELRTPLNAIIGFSEILADKTFGEFNEKQGRYVQNILTSGRHLLQLINDILDLAKIEAGKLVLDPSPFAIATALRDVQVIVSTLANKKGIILSAEVEPNLPPVFADQPKFKQIMYNLLSNAIKFTPEGGKVTITARIQEGDAEASSANQTASKTPDRPRRFVRLSVSDTGIGIKAEHHEKVFKEFEQLDSSYARQQHGTGLGLSLTRKLVEMHGGRIWVESEGVEGKGSAFTFLLPLPNAPAPAEIPASREQAQHQPAERTSGSARSGPLVLVVEDEQHGGELLQEYLTSGGYRVAHAWDGEQAIRMARELQPVAITLDILLPKKNGWEVLSELKADSVTRNIPVVIVSVTSDRQLGFSLGAIEYFVKPVSKDQLLAAVRQASKATGRTVRTVLVVDDDPMTVEFLSTNVRAAGYQVLTASGGQQGIDLAAKHAPDLIILDLMMPEVSGFEVVQRLRQEARTKDIPVLIYTAKELSEEDHRELRDRVQSITSKSGKQDLLRELDRLARLRHRGGQQTL